MRKSIALCAACVLGRGPAAAAMSRRDALRHQVAVLKAKVRRLRRNAAPE